MNQRLAYRRRLDPGNGSYPFGLRQAVHRRVSAGEEVDVRSLFRKDGVCCGLFEALFGTDGTTRLLSNEEEGREFVRSVIEAYLATARFLSSINSHFFFSTFASPVYEDLDDEERLYFDTAIQVLWPVLGSISEYRSFLEMYNCVVRETALRLDVPVLDIASAITGGRNRFKDNCHLTEEAKQTHAGIVFDALRPTLERFAAGAPRVREHPMRPHREPDLSAASISEIEEACLPLRSWRTGN